MKEKLDIKYIWKNSKNCHSLRIEYTHIENIEIKKKHDILSAEFTIILG